MEIFEKLASYFEFPFVRYALIVTVAISICAAMVGVTIVLKRLSNIGDGLSHVAFGALAIGIIINITDKFYIVLPITFLAAFLLLKTKNSKKLKGDSAIAMISVSALALAYFFLNVFDTSSNIAGDVCSTLFGSTAILTLSKTDVLISVILSLVTVALYTIFYNKIFVTTFDENFARASGMTVAIYDVFIALSIASIVVISINLVGSLLVTALLIFPALSAMRLAKSYKMTIIISIILSIVCSVIGVLSSMLMSTPTGPTIVIFYLVVFLVCFAIGKIKERMA